MPRAFFFGPYVRNDAASPVPGVACRVPPVEDPAHPITYVAGDRIRIVEWRNNYCAILFNGNAATITAINALPSVIRIPGSALSNAFTMTAGINTWLQARGLTAGQISQVSAAATVGEALRILWTFRTEQTFDGTNFADGVAAPALDPVAEDAMNG